MPKIKSTRQRIMIMLWALYKYTDAKHPMNLVRLNSFLEPYGLCYNKAVMKDTLRDMQEIGIDVRTRHKWDKHGAWVEERPLNDEALGKLIYAVDSNPYLSKEQVAEVLQSLAPLVTVYQEERLSVVTDRTNETQLPEAVRRAYMVMHGAISTHQSVMFKKSFHRAGAQSAKAVYFMPKRLLLEGGKFFAIGYHHARERIETVDLHEIAEIQLIQLHSPKTAKKAEQVWGDHIA